MAEPKVQLVAPLGNLTVPGMNVTGVVTATLGDVGVAGSIIQGNNIDIGTGIITATSFVGDQIGTYRAASLTGSPDLVVGVVTSSGFVAQITGDVTGNLTGNVVGTAGSILSGNNVRAGIATVAGMSGDGSNLTGIAATSYNTQTVPGSTYSINVTNDGSSAYTLSGTDRNGSVSGNNASVSVEIGDTLNFVVDASGHPFYIRVSDGGANVSTPAATNQGAQSGTVSWTPNTAGTYYYQCGNHAGMIGTITVTATTTIDLSAGNCITFNQSANTTISFANTSTAMDVTIIRDKDDTLTARTITWPASVKWNGGSAPTLISSSTSGDNQQFQFLTRDGGLTWYGWEPFKYDLDYHIMYSWGANHNGKLGLNNTTDTSSPTQVGTDNTWSVKLGTSGSNTAKAIKTDGSLWTWGAWDDGNSGLNNETNYSSPKQIGTDTNWSNISWSTPTKTAAVTKTDGSLWVWGYNGDGNLGLNAPNNEHRSSPAQIPGTWDTGEYKVSGANPGALFAIKSDGTLWAQGWSSFYGFANPAGRRSSPTQLGTDSNWRTIAGGTYYMTAVKTDGTLWTWGHGSGGQLAQNNTTQYSSPRQVGTDTTWDRTFGASDFSGGLKTDGSLWLWGYGTNGQLAQNNTTNYSSPRQVPGSYIDVCGGGIECSAIKSDGTLWFWGQAGDGQSGTNEGNGSLKYSSPVQVGTFTDWKKISPVIIRARLGLRQTG